MCVKALVCSMGAMPAKFVIDRHASRQTNLKKERYDLSVNASHPIVQVQRQYQPRC